MMHCFVEELVDNEWRLSRSHMAGTALVDRDDNWWDLQLADRTGELHGTLVMGCRGKAYPFSFGMRGFPPVMSKDMQGIRDDQTLDWSSIYHSYLTRKDLEDKSAELLLLPEPEALQVRPRLIQFIESLPPHNGDPKHQRIIFWFKN